MNGLGFGIRFPGRYRTNALGEPTRVSGFSSKRFSDILKNLPSITLSIEKKIENQSLFYIRKDNSAERFFKVFSFNKSKIR